MSKGGSGGRWKTPHYQAKMSDKVDMGKAFEVGDQGFWVTFARGMKSKATREIIDLCEEVSQLNVYSGYQELISYFKYGESMYGLQKQSETTQDQAEEEDDEPADIEAAIQKELSNMKSTKPKTRKAFSVVSTNLECLLFVKTMNPVEPVEFVRNICQDARDCTDIMSRKTKYINRLTPVSNMDKSTEKGIDRVARTAMEPYFELVKAEGTDESAEAEKAPKKDEETGPKYAVRDTPSRNSRLIRYANGPCPVRYPSKYTEQFNAQVRCRDQAGGKPRSVRAQGQPDQPG